MRPIHFSSDMRNLAELPVGLPGEGLVLHQRHWGQMRSHTEVGPTTQFGVCHISSGLNYIPRLSPETQYGTSPLAETWLGSESSHHCSPVPSGDNLKHKPLTCLGHSLQRIQNRLASWTEMFLRLFHGCLQLRNPTLRKNSQTLALFYKLGKLPFNDKKVVKILLFYMN